MNRREAFEAIANHQEADRVLVDFGKHHIQAVGACASHLASRIYAMLKEKRPYELRDLNGLPISSQASRDLCLELRVPEEVRKRNNKRFRRAKTEKKRELRTQNGRNAFK